MNYNDIRRKTRTITVGGVRIGGSAKLPIQSMTNTSASDIHGTLAQIRALENAGCDIVRIAVPTIEAAETIRAAKTSGIKVPLVADIHFDYKIALECVRAGVDKVRINPGNIGSDDKVREVCAACADRGIPIRIGVNGGSVEKKILEKYGAPSPDALCESALYHIGLLEKFGFYDIAVSIKTTNVADFVAANRILASKCDYPIHLGVTEAGTAERGILKNAVGIGSLLLDGIGDTLRVSLTDDPVSEVRAAKRILDTVGIDGQRGMNIISCPTCGRTKIDLVSLANRFEAAAAEEGLLDIPINVALMGCVVNGPGEAHEADIGIAGGDGEALMFERGTIIGKIDETEIIETLIKKIKAKYR